MPYDCAMRRLVPFSFAAPRVNLPAVSLDGLLHGVDGEHSENQRGADDQEAGPGHEFSRDQRASEVPGVDVMTTGETS
jgi:hypothetical protein